MLPFFHRIARGVARAARRHWVAERDLWSLAEPVHLKRFLRHFAVDCVFDVGANEGQYAERLRANGFKGPIVSFEPIPALAAALREKAARDGNWFVEETALHAAAHDTSFNVMNCHEFSSLLPPDHGATRKFRQMNGVASTLALTTGTLDVYFARYAERLGFARPFLKMDTQGNDINVARGAGASLARFVGLQSELALTPLYAGAPSYREALDFYAAAGFKLSALVPNNKGAFPDLFEVDCIMYRA